MRGGAIGNTSRSEREILGSSPSPAAMKNRQEIIPYEEVFRELNRAEINYAVCGGAAVVMFGFARLTVDLDLVVGLERENLEKLYESLFKLGYRFSMPIKKEDFLNRENLRKLALEKNMKVVSFHNLKDPFKVIDVGVNLPMVPQILKNRKIIRVKGLSIPMISLDDLIKTKKDLARPKDLIDVENLKKIKKYEKRNS